MIFVVAVALAASVFYGASDFLGAYTARKLTVLKTSTFVYFTATLVGTVGLFVSTWTYSDVALRAGSIAGVFAAVGMVTFYAALAIGPMSLLAPLIALIQTSIPVVVAAVTGQSLRPIAWVAVVMALVATTLISVPARAETGHPPIERITARGGLLAVFAGITLGLSVVTLDIAPAESGVFPAFLDLAVGLVLLAPFLAVRRLRTSDTWLYGHPAASGTLPVEAPSANPGPAGPRIWVLSGVGGVLLGIGNILLVVALHAGNLAVVAVLVSLYPLATVLLAWFVLKERISRVQFLGVALAITAAVLLGVS
ncbi:MAG: EamA family transporter [Salinibacterium sp.]|nr:EamA family transporter [Salinibacterium sp.]